MDCNTKLKNTGRSECPLEMGIISSVLVVPQSVQAKFTSGTFDEFLTGLIHAPESGRGYPFPVMIDIEPNISEPKFETTSVGVNIFIGDGDASFSLIHRQDMDLLKRLRSFNGQMFDCFLIDRNNQVWGKTVSDGAVGIPMTITVVNGDPRSGDSSPKMKTIYSFYNPSDYHNIEMVGDTELSVSMITGLSNVTITNVGTAIAPKLKLWIQGSDVTSRYKTLLANKLLWVYDGAVIAGGATITYDAASDSFTGFGTTASNKEIGLAAPSVLAASDVLYIEGTLFKLT